MLYLECHEYEVVPVVRVDDRRSWNTAELYQTGGRRYQVMVGGENSPHRVLVEMEWKSIFRNK